MHPLLTIKNLSVSFKQDDELNPAVKNISFTLDKNETVAIVGESGSGKSVTALSILNLLPKTAKMDGEIIFYPNNHDPIILNKLSDEDIRVFRGNDISMIFQEPMTSLNPVFNCGHQVMEAIMLHKKLNKTEAKKLTIVVFEKVKLPNPDTIINRYPHELSGGQKQRVMIAMAIICNPLLLIADEPTTALDVTVQRTILTLIKELQIAQAMSVLLITHDLGVVADVADKIVVLYKGEIVEQGNTKDILFNPQHWYTKALLSCRPAAADKGVKLPTVSDFNEHDQMSSPGKEANPTSDSLQSLGIEKNSNEAGVILKVEHLSVQFTQRKKLFKPSVIFKAVDDVSFSVKRGETIGLVGESGCGKTTLGRAILQLIPVHSGKIILEGRDIVGLTADSLRKKRKDFQIVFQDPYGSLNPRLSIGEAILEPLKVHSILGNTRQRKDKVIDLLQKVNLSADMYNRYPHQFSGGQRQRICIARALALEPSFLIFDESVSALDVSIQAQVLNLLNDLKKEFNYTSIFISHDLAVVHYISDRILIMHQGKIIEEGNANDVYHHPQQAYTQRLIEAIPGKKLYRL